MDWWDDWDSDVPECHKPPEPLWFKVACWVAEAIAIMFLLGLFMTFLFLFLCVCKGAILML